MQRVGVEQAKEQLPELVHAAMQGEDVFIQQSEHKAVRLVPDAQPRQTPKFGSAKGMIEMDDDFDAPLDDFKEYM